MTHLLNGGNIPILGEKKRLLHVRDVATPKISEIGLQPGYFIARPLRAPCRHDLILTESFEGERWYVLKSEPEERPELAWTKNIKAGTVVTMAGPTHHVPMRVDLAGTLPLGAANEAGLEDSEGRIIGDAILLIHAQVVAYDTRTLNPDEHQGVALKLAGAGAEHAENTRIDQGLNE